MTLNVFIAVSHLLGVGHLTRAAAIARGLAARGHRVTLVSGGKPAGQLRTEGVSLVQLPAVHIEGTDFSRLLDGAGAAASPALLRARRERLLAALHETVPDVVITELFPFGRRALADEFMALVEAARALQPRPAVLCSVRDILVTPARPERIEEAHQRLRRFYDGVLVHGDPAVATLEQSWPLPRSLKPIIHYTGYIDDVPASSELPADVGSDEVIVSAGGSEAGRALYRTALSSARLMPEQRWRILVGGGLAEAEFERLRHEAPANAVVERARADFPALLSRCAVSVSQAGYNTVLDLQRARVRAVVVPFAEGGETEQRQRAACFAARGAFTVLPADQLDPVALADAVRSALARAPPAPHDFRSDGLATTAALVEAIGVRAAPPPAIAKARCPAWALLDDGLRCLADEGRSIDLWWRDDDAKAPTPALERLLDLAMRLAMPLAVAAVPAKAVPALAARLVDEPLASVLVHGLAHRNHAPDGEKKSEFGMTRPLECLCADAAAALKQATAGFGDKALRVFVPPWNRLAPLLIERLPALGYRGVSSFGTRKAREPAAGLIQVNVQIDPIDWHGGRGLRTESDIIATVVDALQERRMDAREPLGLLTHHLVHDEETWTFCERLLETLACHSTVRPRAAIKLFGQGID